MINMASTSTWVAVAFFAAFLALAYPSMWLRGSRWYLLTIAALAGFAISFAVEDVLTSSGLSMWLGLAFQLLIFGFFFYFISIKYLTQTRLLDLTYQSHSALTAYIKENTIASPLASFVRVLGPILFIALLALGGLGMWAENNGLLK